MATQPLPGVAPVSSENLQFVIPVDSVGEPPLVAPVLQENMQFVMPEVREPSMYEMTRDFNEFKSYYQAGAFDSDIEGVGDVTDIALEAGGAILSDVGSWLGTLPIRLMQNFTDDKYEFNRRAKAEAKATTLQTLGSLRENYEALGAGIKRGVYKMTEDEGSDLDLYSAWKYWQKTADLENQRQGLAAEVLADGIFGISGDAWTAGMSDEEKKWIREGTVKPDVQSAMGGAMIADPLNYVPVGVAFRGATGGGKAALTGAERVLLKETQDMLNLQAKMLPTSKFFLAANTAEMTAKGARQKAALAELNTKIAANSAKLAPLAQKRSIALNAMKDSLPDGSAMRGLIDDALADVPISAGRNITGIAAASAPVVAGKAIETLGNVGAFLKMLPYETAVNTVMKIAEKSGKEISEETAKKWLIGGAVFGTGYASTGRSDSGALEFQLPDIGKVELAAAASAILGPAFLKRFGRDLAIAGRQLANPKETLPYFGALRAKGSEKLVDQIIDRDVLVPVASVARQVTGAAEGKIPQRMFLPQGKLGPASSGIATFMDRSGLGRYAETAGRAARGGAQGAAVTGAFGLAASGGMENPEAFYGSLGVGAILGTAGSTFGSVARFDSPAQHWTARYGDYEYYVKNYLGEGQKENFNKLNRDLQIAVAHKIVTNPALAVEFVSKGKTAGGGHLNRLTNALEINVDSPRAAEALISHEFTHYLEQTGGKLAFNELLIGNSILGKPGIFVEKVTPETKSKYPDLNVGDPIMVGEEGARRYKLSEEFETARKEYKEKLKDTDEFSNLTEEQLDLIMTDELVVSEIVAEHGTDFFANDRRRYRDLHRGAIGKVMEGLLETQLASNVPFLRKALAMFGGTFRPDGRLITDNALFSKLKRYPQITELVRKYNRRTEGLSPEQMKKKTASVDGDGNVISPKDVVVDVTGAELSKNPELVDLIRAGTFLQIDKDGNVIPNLAMTAREKGKYNRSFAQSLKDAIEKQEADTGLPEGHVKPEVNEKTGKVRFVGRYLDDSVLDAVEQSGNWNKEQIAMLREANNNIKNRGGNEFLISYFKAAHQGGRRYINAKVENLVEVPYGIEITQKGNVILRTVSVDQLIKNVDQLTRQQQAELTRLYGADLNAAKAMFLNDVDAYHRNHAAGNPGRTGLDADPAIAKAKADFINSAFGSGTKAQVDANPWRAGLGKKQPRDVYRSRRIERIGKMTQLSGERYVDYNLINKAFMPRRKPNQPDDTIPLPFDELPGDKPGEGFGRMVNVDKTKAEMAEAKRLADEAQSGFSSSGNVRSKDAYGRDKLFMPADRALGLPDNIRDEVLPGIKQDKFSRGQLEAALLKSAGSKAYAEEIGLMDWLKDRKSVTKAEVDQFVRENAPRLEEKVLGEAELTGKELPEGWNITPSIPSTRPSGRAFPPKWEITDQHGRVVWDHPKTVSLDEALALFEKSEAVDMTKFSGYQEPGGTNYREVLIKLPEKSANNSEIQALRQEVQSILEKRQALEAEGKYGESNALSPEMNARQARIQKLQSQDNFRDPHFREDNVLLHLRLNDRIDANGKKVLFIEELQSDWHQKGRKDGYAGQHARPYKIIEDSPTSFIIDFTDPDGSSNVHTGFESRAQAERAAQRRKDEGVPDAPFKKNWPALGLKRAIREALENGYDRIAWLDGEGQAARYDLSQQVDAIRVTRDKDGTYEIMARSADDMAELGEFQTLATKVAKEKLADYIGKEPASKALDKMKDGVAELSGLDLKVGGEGMKAFYDRELVSIANKISKKIGGGKVRRETIEMDWLRPADQPDGVQISSHVLDLPKNPQAVENLRLYMPAQKAPSDSGVPTILKDAKGRGALVQPRVIESGFGTENIDAPKFVDKVLGDLKVDVQRTNFEKPEVNLADHYGKNALITMADRTPTDHVIYGINDVQFKTPLRLEGGRDYMFDSAHSPGAAWANEQNAMTAMLNRREKLGGEDMLVIPMEMAPTSVDFPTMAPALHIRYAQVAMKAKDKRYVNSLVKKGGKGFLTESQDQVKVPKFDIDMENVEAFLSKLTGPQRKTINNVFDMVNRPSSAQKDAGVKQIEGALSNFEMRAAISDPAMFNQKSLMQTTNVGLMTGGQAPSMHSTYNAAMRGEGLGVLKVPEGFQPKAQDFLPDLFKKSNKDYVHPNDAFTARRGVRTAKIDEALLKRLGL